MSYVRFCVEINFTVLRDSLVDFHDRLIKIPSSFEAWTLTWLMVISMFIGMVTVTYFYIRRKMKRKYLLAKIERRRSRRSSEESARNSQQADAFKVT